MQNVPKRTGHPSRREQLAIQLASKITMSFITAW